MSRRFVCLAGGVMLALALVAGSGGAVAAQQPQPAFSTPEDAMAAMVGAMRRQLPNALATLVGPGSQAWLFSGDPVADRAAVEKFLALYEKKHVVARQGEDWASVTVGDDDWPQMTTIAAIADYLESARVPG